MNFHIFKLFTFVFVLMAFAFDSISAKPQMPDVPKMPGMPDPGKMMNTGMEAANAGMEAANAGMEIGKGAAQMGMDHIPKADSTTH